MTETYIQGIGLVLGSDPATVKAQYGMEGGHPYALLRIGDGINFHATAASPELLRRLAACATELADWREAQDVEAEGRAAA